MLSFATAGIIDNQILEIQPHNDIEISTAMIAELDTLLSDGHTPKLVLINRENEYSFTFEGMLASRRIRNIKAMAIYSKKPASRSAATIIHGELHQSGYPYQTFASRDEAINWLLAQQSEI